MSLSFYVRTAASIFVILFLLSACGRSNDSTPIQETVGGPVPEISPKAYDFSQPVPEREAVDNSYFEDAAFIGDSRTAGFLLYSGIGCGDDLTSNGLSIFRLAEKKVLTIDGEEYTLLEALALKPYGKVYLSFGINELGYDNDDGFFENYSAAIDAIRDCQPDAVIYAQALIPINEAITQERTGKDYFTNEHLRTYNALIQRIASEKQVAYLDLYAIFADESGDLPEEDSTDGIHLRGEACRRWLEYLKTHTTDLETLYRHDDGA